ncbi:hypothetical protein [Mesorhizobium sp. CAU 1741]|uniref:hypothetical protein n=1 Tax=Mesorhizobium sp. CAU 1741 TaxID=3140366 RepID=UPI00325A6C00
MPPFALANALKDFGAPPSSGADSLVEPMGFPGLPDMELPEFDELIVSDAVDTEALIAEAVAEAEAALTERLTQEHADALQMERDRHTEELTELQGQFAEEASAKIEAGMEAMENRLIELTGAVTARILGVVLTDDIRERSIERLAEIIRKALTDDEAVRIHVTGSLPLFDALKVKLPRYAEQFDFVESANFDLSVTIDDSVFETRLAEWSTLLAETLS